jgi:MFS family permease
VYLPELFPTHVRAAAVSFCNGSGRVITSFGPLLAGLLAGSLNDAFNQATAVMTCFAALSIVAAVLGRETKDDVLRNNRKLRLRLSPIAGPGGNQTGVRDVSILPPRPGAARLLLQNG